MKRTAIFVEGQTELIFVREYLLKIFDYQGINVECYTLFTDSKFIPTEYPYPNDSATHHFLIINVGNDNAVLSRILNREKYLLNQGFDSIIGLRDMYSKAYREVNPTAGKINTQINVEFIENTQLEITKRAISPDNIVFQYAIMEAESWILGFNNCFTKLHILLTNDYIEQRLGYNLALLDPEMKFYHPANEVEKIYKLVGSSYDKSKSDVNAIMSTLTKDDFIELSESSKCESFKRFHQNFIFP